MATALAQPTAASHSAPLEITTCDGCGVRACVTTSFPLVSTERFGELSWCSHHFRQHEPALRSRYGPRLLVDDRRRPQ